MQGETGLAIVSFGNRSGGWNKKCLQLLAAEKGEKTDHSLEPPEGTQLCQQICGNWLQLPQETKTGSIFMYTISFSFHATVFSQNESQYLILFIDQYWSNKMLIFSY